MSIQNILSIALQDRTTIVGGAFSVPTFLAGITLPEVHEWVKFYATCIGAIGTTLVVVYTALRIIRMLKDKKAKE